MFRDVLSLAWIVRGIDVRDRKRPLAVNLNHCFGRCPRIMIQFRGYFAAFLRSASAHLHLPLLSKAPACFRSSKSKHSVEEGRLALLLVACATTAVLTAALTVSHTVIAKPG